MQSTERTTASLKMATRENLADLLKEDHYATLPLSLRNWIRARKDLNQTEKSVFESYLEDSFLHKKPQLISQLSVSVLATRIGKDERTVKRANAKLTKIGLISKSGLTIKILIPLEDFESIQPSRPQYQKTSSHKKPSCDFQNVSENTNANINEKKESSYKSNSSPQTEKVIAKIPETEVSDENLNFDEQEKLEQKISELEEKFGLIYGSAEYSEKLRSFLFKKQKLSGEDMEIMALNQQITGLIAQKDLLRSPKKPSERLSNQNPNPVKVSSVLSSQKPVMKKAKWENNPRNLSFTQKLRVKERVGQLGKISCPESLIDEIIFSLEYGLFQDRALNHGLNVAISMVKKGSWRTPYGMNGSQNKGVSKCA